MGVTLYDLANDDRWVDCNWWNWRPTIEILRLSKLFDDDRLELMGYNGCAEVSEVERGPSPDIWRSVSCLHSGPGIECCSMVRSPTSPTTSSSTGSPPSTSGTTVRPKLGCENSQRSARSAVASGSVEHPLLNVRRCPGWDPAQSNESAAGSRN